MREFFRRIWTQESAFRGLLVVLGGVVPSMAGLPPWIGAVIMGLAVSISSGDKNQTPTQIAEAVKKLEKKGG